MFGYYWNCNFFFFFFPCFTIYDCNFLQWLFIFPFFLYNCLSESTLNVLSIFFFFVWFFFLWILSILNAISVCKFLSFTTQTTDYGRYLADYYEFDNLQTFQKTFGQSERLTAFHICLTNRGWKLVGMVVEKIQIVRLRKVSIISQCFVHKC